MGAVQILWRLPRGRTALYIGPSVASEEAAILAKARNLVHVAEHNGVSKSRLLITVSSLSSYQFLVPDMILRRGIRSRLPGREFRLQKN